MIFAGYGGADPMEASISEQCALLLALTPLTGPAGLAPGGRAFRARLVPKRARRA
jgi:hypothetical protein